MICFAEAGLFRPRRGPYFRQAATPVIPDPLPAAVRVTLPAIVPFLLRPPDHRIILLSP